MRYKIGDFVREGGPLGPVSQIVGVLGDCYVLKSEFGATGYLEEEYLKPFKRYEQLSLFES